MRLIKLSYPGWEKDFDTEQEIKLELFSHICRMCCDGYTEECNGEIVYEQEPITIDSSIDDMLWTACGCEFCVDY